MACIDRASNAWSRGVLSWTDSAGLTDAASILRYARRLPQSCSRLRLRPRMASCCCRCLVICMLSNALHSAAWALNALCVQSGKAFAIHDTDTEGVFRRAPCWCHALCISRCNQLMLCWCAGKSRTFSISLGCACMFNTQSDEQHEAGALAELSNQSALPSLMHSVPV